MRMILTKHGDVIEQIGTAVRTLEHKADTMLRLAQKTSALLALDFHFHATS